MLDQYDLRSNVTLTCFLEMLFWPLPLRGHRADVQYSEKMDYLLLYCILTPVPLLLPHTLKHTPRPRPWNLGPGGLPLISPSPPVPTNWVGQPRGWVCMRDAGCSSLKIYTPAMLLSWRYGGSHSVKCHCESPVMKQPPLLQLQTWRVLQLSILSLPSAILPFDHTAENTWQYYEAIKQVKTHTDYYMHEISPRIRNSVQSGINFKFIAAESYWSIFCPQSHCNQPWLISQECHFIIMANITYSVV